MIVMNRLNTENVFEDLDGLAEVEVARELQLVRRGLHGPSSVRRMPVQARHQRRRNRSAGVLAKQRERDTRNVVLRPWGAQPDQPEHAAVSSCASAVLLCWVQTVVAL